MAITGFVLRSFRKNGYFFYEICRRMATSTKPDEDFTNAKSGHAHSYNQTKSSEKVDPLNRIKTHLDDRVASNFEWIKNHASTFKLHGSKVEIIQEPSGFHTKLKDLARNSKKRILLASLYLGTGSQEAELVESLEESLQSSRSENGNLRVTVILDHMRGSRGVVNSRSMLMPIIKKFFKPSTASEDASEQTSMQLFLYHTPDLKGWLKQILPERFNEVVGLFHIKLYIFDDSVIISGANLSQSYFADRQDRYILINNFKPLADFYDRLLTAISRFSFLVQPDDSLHYSNEDWHPYLNESSNAEFRNNLKKEVEEITKPCEVMDCPDEGRCDTIIHPLVQMGPIGVDQDRLVTEFFLKKLPADSSVFLASGYFNLTDEYMNIIINQSQANFSILTAAPQANSFFESSGISKHIPSTYTEISKNFLQDVHSKKQESRISIQEYIRPQWTVHAKGIWVYPPKSETEPNLPYMTLIGSPNYGYRSVKRDLESQAVIITSNNLLRNQLHQEKGNLYKNSEGVSMATFASPERTTPLWLIWLAPRIKNFF